MPDPLAYFGIQPPGNSLSQYFPNQDENALRDRLEERPTSRMQIPLEYQVASQLPDPSGFLSEVNRIRGGTEAKKLIGELGDLDFGDKSYPSSLAKLFSRYPDAAQNPAVQNILKLKEFAGKQATDSKYDSQASQAVKGLLGISEDDPNYDQKFQSYIAGLDPDVLSHPRLASLLERGQHNSAMIRSKRTTDQQANQLLDRQLIKSGLKPGSYSSIEDKQDALADLMHENAQQEGLQKHFQTFKDDAKEYASAMRALRTTPSDEDKIAAMGKTSASQMSASDWAQGDAKVRRQNMDRLQAISDQLQLQTGVNPLRGAQAARPAPATPPAQAPVAAPAPVVPSVQPVAPVAPTSADAFGRIQQAVDEPAKKRAEETVATQAAQKALVPQWESAKQDLIKSLGPEAIQRVAAGLVLDPRQLVKYSGKDPEKVLFTDENGFAVRWPEIAKAVMEDPRFKTAMGQQEGPAPIQTPSGNRVTLTPIVKTP